MCRSDGRRGAYDRGSGSGTGYRVLKLQVLADEPAQEAASGARRAVSSENTEQTRPHLYLHLSGWLKPALGSSIQVPRYMCWGCRVLGVGVGGRYRAPLLGSSTSTYRYGIRMHTCRASQLTLTQEEAADGARHRIAAHAAGWGRESALCGHCALAVRGGTRRADLIAGAVDGASLGRGLLTLTAALA